MALNVVRPASNGWAVRGCCWRLCSAYSRLVAVGCVCDRSVQLAQLIAVRWLLPNASCSVRRVRTAALVLAFDGRPTNDVCDENDASVQPSNARLLITAVVD